MNIKEALKRIKQFLDDPWPLHKDSLNGRGSYVLGKEEFDAIEYLYNYLTHMSPYFQMAITGNAYTEESKCRIGDGVAHEYNKDNICIWCGEESKEEWDGTYQDRVHKDIGEGRPVKTVKEKGEDPLKDPPPYDTH